MWVSMCVALWEVWGHDTVENMAVIVKIDQFC
jgi:hypothetical protein